MADETSNQAKRHGFWTTAPGILTGIAAVITAVATLVGALFAAGVLHGSSNAASGRTASGAGGDGAGVSPTPSWQRVSKQGVLVLRNAETASLDRGAAAVAGTYDFLLVVDADAGNASIGAIFSNVYFAPFVGVPDADACTTTLASQKRQSMQVEPETIGKWICVSTYEDHVGAIQPVKISAERKEVTFNFVLWKDSPSS